MQHQEAKRVIAYGFVKDNYEYSTSYGYHAHFRKVDWHEGEVTHKVGIGTLRKNGREVREYLKEIYGLNFADFTEDIVEDINKIESDETIFETQKKQLIDARRGHGKFRQNVSKLEKGGCRITGVTDM